VESALTPADAPPLSELDLGVSYTSATETAHLGGDFYDVIELDGGDILLVVGDYSGKGIGAAGMAARARFALAGAVRADAGLDEILVEAEMNLQGTLPAGKFVTVVACRYSSDGRLVAALAGHPPPVLMKIEGEIGELHLPHNPPLLAVDDACFRQGEARLLPEEGLLLYTDGITESRRNGEFFGLDGIARVWREMSERSPADVASGLCASSAEFHEEDLPGDDRLALVIRPRVKKPPEP
jgi:serine phosphatase RsbU (regulator of sigma subunit)